MPKRKRANSRVAHGLYTEGSALPPATLERDALLQATKVHRCMPLSFTRAPGPNVAAHAMFMGQLHEQTPTQLMRTVQEMRERGDVPRTTLTHLIDLLWAQLAIPEEMQESTWRSIAAHATSEADNEVTGQVVDLTHVPDDALYTIYDALSITKPYATEQWVLCDDCAKWRRLPLAHAERLPEQWRCAMHPSGIGCDHPEDRMDEDEAVL